jgi:hypothetical protein
MNDPKETKQAQQHKNSKTARPKPEKKHEQKPVIRQSHLHEMVVIKKPSTND